jgi:hypothetical protein
MRTLCARPDRIGALSAAPDALAQATDVQPFDEPDRALEFFEDRLTGDAAAPALVSLRDQPVLRGCPPPISL